MTAAKEYRSKNAEELATTEGELRKALFEAQYKHAAGQLEDTASIRRARKDLARVLTVKTEKNRTDKKGNA